MRPKDAMKTENLTNCVYKISCLDCDGVYIGQTSRQVGTRITEHKRKAKYPPKDPKQLKQLDRDSAIALHALAESHSVDFEKPTVLQHGFRTHKERLISEALAIASNPSCINRSDGSMIAQVWLGLAHTTEKRRKNFRSGVPGTT